MIVCVCNNVSEDRLRQAINTGMTSMTALRKELGVGTGCGKCHTCVKQVLRECLNNSNNQTQHIAQTITFHHNALVA